MSQPRTKSFQIEVDQLEAIKAWAAKSGKSDSEVIRTALDEGLMAFRREPSLIMPKRPAKADIHPPADETVPPMGSTTFAAGLAGAEETPDEPEETDETVLEKDSRRRPRGGAPKRPGSPKAAPLEKAAAPFRKGPPKPS